jgi:tRNA threonylcarbamoyladenosine biosynthesis protein TsaB
MTPNLTLAVDTTADWGSIALADENGVRDEIELDAPRGFSMVLFAGIEALLQRQDVRLRDVELFAAASGPGSFTGVRVGLAAVKGLAEVEGKRAVGVSNLEALAEFGQSEARATIIDARRGEVYAALYDGAGNQIVPEMVGPFERFLALLPAREIEWIATGFDALAGLPAGARKVVAPRAIAGAIARIAIRRAAAGSALDPAAVDANYVRRSDAELFWKET